MKDNILVELSTEFAVNIVNWCDNTKGKSVFTNQLSLLPINMNDDVKNMYGHVMGTMRSLALNSENK